MAQRYFVPELAAGERLVVTGELAHHLGRVLRARPGQEVRLGDGRGHRAAARIASVGRDEVALEIGPVEGAHAPRPRVVLAFAAPRQARTEWLFEHGTEIGIAVFQPLRTARSRPEAERAERWQRLVRAAAGQCDRDWLPEVRPALALAELLASPLPNPRFVGDPGAPPLEPSPQLDDAVLLVGPEGGFDEEERAAIRAAGFTARRYGPHTLRTETAAIVGAAILLAHSGTDH